MPAGLAVEDDGSSLPNDDLARSGNAADSCCLVHRPPEEVTDLFDHRARFDPGSSVVAGRAVVRFDDLEFGIDCAGGVGKLELCSVAQELDELAAFPTPDFVDALVE